MLIKFGSIVTDGRGKLGGHVYSKNRGGSYVRTNAVPDNPQTSFQQAGRARTGGLSQAWSGLTQAEIAAWNGAVGNFKRTNVFGDSKELSGKNLFVSLNYMALLVDESRMDSPPSPQDVETPTNLEIPKVGASDWKIDVTLSGKADHLVIRATPPMTAGTNYFKNRLRIIQIEDAQDSGKIDVLDAYEERFGTPTEGQRVGFEIFAVTETGQKSPVFRQSTIVENQ